MNIFSQMCRSLPFYKELERLLEGGYTPAAVTGVSSIHKSLLAMDMAEKRRVLVICDDEAACTRLVSDINELARRELACIFPAKDLNFAYMEGISREYEHRRIEALSKLTQGSCRIIAASAEAAMQATVPPEKLKEYSFTLSQGSEVAIPDLMKKLISAGYTRTEQVEGQAQFAVRGSIVDIFPVQESRPLRMELWGDEIDSLSYFDTESQRRTDPIDKITVFPSLEIIFGSSDELISKLNALSAGVRGKLTDKIRQHIARDIECAEAGILLSDLDKYYTLAYGGTYTVFDYFDSSDSVCMISEYRSCEEHAKAVTAQLREDIQLLVEDGIMFKKLEGFAVEFPQVMHSALSLPAVFADTFMRQLGDIKIKKLINTDCRQTGVWGGNITHLEEELRSFSEQGYCTVVLAGSEKTLPIICQDLRDDGLDARIMTEDSQILPGVVYLRTGSLSGGFDFPDIGCASITQMKAMTVSRKAKKKRKKGEEIGSLSDIAKGDLVVHTMYGIGRFAGIRNLETNGVKKDYISIQYAGTDVLYVPVTQLDLVSRYIGPRDDGNVKLNKLNSVEWTRTRTRVKAAVRDMADELTKLYAERQKAKGFAFSPDSDWQNDFEQRFDYQETDDQLRAIREIKEDMQKEAPMDRLLCGDVGFGKTEVALRAAFKCVLDSKQCAIMVPTTVLAWQHYQTAIKRFEHFPVKVELLSRFRTPKQQAEVIRGLKRGTVDIVIGTHRLVQKDVEFKDLGLAIIDEEQRFGVAHKEKFKEAFKGVDILTLSATPIPRTLNMALSGIRDMSVIEEPPQDRQPIQTYVIEHDDGVIAQAIFKELRRGGQVYYLHNRVETIHTVTSKLGRLLPDARIGVAHGQMSEAELSEIWRQLIDREIDILVCTTIIETGVDVPNVNTLIIEDADRLGLSQLHQIRGRVGRSSRRAFAYLTFRRGKVLSEVAERRLTAIKEFTQFGSGFHIAMRDLEIRGAGSILSGRQHGHMEAVGYDMYLRLLNEAVAEQQGLEIPHSPEDCLVDISINAYLPEDYIEDLPQRIEAYRRIASIITVEDSRDVLDELIDRYGEPPQSVTGLINVALTRNIASRLRVTQISQRQDRLLFYIKAPEVSQLRALIDKYGDRLRFAEEEKPYFSVRLAKGEKAPELMSEVINLLDSSKDETQ
ncbi:MAG: transcription-repair coupling factor [Ruminococcus sp.]|nr:transcription-repair coupling factor [Ruminococcus sp.]